MKMPGCPDGLHPARSRPGSRSMFIAHLPAGYILTHCIARKNETIRSRALAVGLIFSVLPDLDLLYFYLGDGRRTPHHDYWTHLPIFWLGVAALTAAALTLAGKRHSMFLVWVALANVMMHLLLDSIAADIRWLLPFRGPASTSSRCRRALSPGTSISYCTGPLRRKLRSARPRCGSGGCKGAGTVIAGSKETPQRGPSEFTHENDAQGRVAKWYQPTAPRAHQTCEDRRSCCAAAGRASARAGYFLRRRQQTFALKLLARQLAGAADSFCFFADALFGRFFVGAAHLHFAEDAFTLHLLLENAKSLVDVIVPDEYLQSISFPFL